MTIIWWIVPTANGRLICYSGDCPCHQTTNSGLVFNTAPTTAA